MDQQHKQQQDELLALLVEVLQLIVFAIPFISMKLRGFLASVCAFGISLGHLVLHGVDLICSSNSSNKSASTTTTNNQSLRWYKRLLNGPVRRSVSFVVVLFTQVAGMSHVLRPLALFITPGIKLPFLMKLGDVGKSGTKGLSYLYRFQLSNQTRDWLAGTSKNSNGDKQTLPFGRLFHITASGLGTITKWASSARELIAIAFVLHGLAAIHESNSLLMGATNSINLLYDIWAGTAPEFLTAAVVELLACVAELCYHNATPGTVKSALLGLTFSSLLLFNFGTRYWLMVLTPAQEFFDELF